MSEPVTRPETADERAAREARERLSRDAQGPDTNILDMIMGFLRFLFESFFPSSNAPDEDPGDRASTRASAGEIARLGRVIIDRNAIPNWRAYQQAHRGEAVNFVNPVEGGFSPITRDFGMHKHPIHGDERMHAGADLKPLTSGANPNILASAGGIVLFAGWKSGYGNTVIIGHADGSYTLYGHMRDEPSVEIGSEVRLGQRIGVMGRSGGATGEHLHYEQRRGESAVEPTIGGVALRSGVSVAAYQPQLAQAQPAAAAEQASEATYPIPGAVRTAARNVVHLQLETPKPSNQAHQRYDVADVGSAIGQAFSAARTSIGGFFRV